MAKVQVNVINADRAKRSIDGLVKRLKGPDKVLVGVQKGAGNYDDGLALAVVAAVNHFGSDTVGIPERRFLDIAIQNKKEKYSAIAARLIPQVLEGKMDMEQVLNAIGLAAVADVQEFMVKLRSPPNHPETIKRKGSSNPLIDNGTLRQSIRHEIAREPVEEGL